MNIEITKLENQVTSAWSGGSTTQLFIHPSNSEYKKLNFLFRISTATVEVEKSEFTLLPNISRKIMILDGDINIEHKNHYKKHLNKFDIDEFEGDWQTTSVGKCVDFNVMISENILSELDSVILNTNKTTQIPTNLSIKYVFIYVYSGSLELNTTQKLNKGDFVKLDNIDSNTINIQALENSELIITKILK